MSFRRHYIRQLGLHTLAGPAEAKLNWSVRVRDCVRKHAAARGSKDPQGKFDALRSLLRPFLDPSSALSVALGRLDSDSIWYTSMCVEHMVWFEHRVYFCTNTKFVSDSFHACSKKLGGDRERGLHEIVAANAAVGTGIFISKFAIAQPRKRRTLQPGPNNAIRAAAASDERCS